MDIGSRIRFYRDLRGLSQRQLACRLHMAASQLSRYETGRTEPTLGGAGTHCTGPQGLGLGFLLRKVSPMEAHGERKVPRSRPTAKPRRARSAGGICPVSRVFCEDYRDCRRRNYCWLKSRDPEDGWTSDG